MNMVDRYLMKKISFRLYSKLSVVDTIKKIAGLLACEHVSFNTDQNFIKSTHIPFPIVNVDQRMYTRKNWVGINPFIFITGVEIFLTELDTKETQIDIGVDQNRAILIYLCFLCLVLLVALAIPILWVGISFFFLIAIVTGFFIFNVCIKGLIKSEIVKAIMEQS